MSAKKLHYSDGRGFGTTACGKSTHMWQGARTPAHTADLRRVECTRCLKVLKKGR